MVGRPSKNGKTAKKFCVSFPPELHEKLVLESESSMVPISRILQERFKNGHLGNNSNNGNNEIIKLFLEIFDYFVSNGGSRILAKWAKENKDQYKEYLKILEMIK